MTAVTTAVPLRVLVAVHGHEPAGWAEETCRVVSTWAGSRVHLLAVLDVPSPPLTSLTGAALRAYAGARTQWAELERLRLEPSIAALLAGLPHDTDVARAPATQGDLAWTIARHARTWPADVVVVGGPSPGLRAWLRPGPVHHRVVRLAGCAVLVTTPPALARRGARREVTAPHAALAAVERRA